MGWELTDFKFEHQGELARVFTFEVKINGPDYPDDLLISGDGIVLQNNKVRLNREQHLAEVASRSGLNAQELIEGLKQLAVTGEFKTEAAPA